MEILKSKNFSLLCAIINGLLGMQALVAGQWVFGMVCLALCVFCTNNYRNPE